jgi:nucleoside phosphorylase
VAETLVLSAWGPEIAPLARMARPGPGDRGRAGTFTAVAVGVGPIEAAIGATRAIAAHAPRRVIFVGTAGVYGPRTDAAALGSAAVAGELTCVSTAALRGDGYLPEIQIVRTAASHRLSRSLAAEAGAAAQEGAPAPVAAAVAGAVAVAIPVAILGVACPLAITRSAALGRQIARATGAALENLEAFGVARAAAAAKVEFAAVLGVANRVGPTGHREWRAHHLAASRAACRLVATYLRASQKLRADS